METSVSKHELDLCGDLLKMISRRMDDGKFVPTDNMSHDDVQKNINLVYHTLKQLYIDYIMHTSPNSKIQVHEEMIF